MSRNYPWWKYYLSYLSELTLEVREGAFGDYLAVLLQDGRVLLQANDAIYSWEDYYYNFRSALERLRWGLLPGKRCLILGLGLGSIPQIIEERIGKQLSYTAIEYDEVVAELAQRYLLHRLQSPLEVVVADAYRFVEQCSDTYDLILVDLFVNDNIPPQFFGADFLEHLSALLHSEGCLISNMLYQHAVNRQDTDHYVDCVFSEQFPNYDLVSVQANRMLFSDKKFIKDNASET